MQSASYQDAIAIEFCKNCKEAEHLIKLLKYAGTPIKFVDWTKNSVTYSIRGIYGLTYT